MAILAFGVLAAIVYFSTKLELKPLIGRLVPDMTYVDQYGRQQNISKAKGSVVLIYFWAILCEPCVSEMPHLRALEDHFDQKGFILLAFDVDKGGEDIRVRLKGGEYPRGLIFNFSKRDLRSYVIKGLPMSILIDKKGVVTDVFYGPRRWMEIEMIRKIEALVE